jgi:hypothetical protein
VGERREEGRDVQREEREGDSQPASNIQTDGQAGHTNIHTAYLHTLILCNSNTERETEREGGKREGGRKREKERDRDSASLFVAYTHSSVIHT